MSSESQEPRDPQTTPFVQPSICAELFTTTTFLAYPDSDGHHPTIEALVQDTSDPRYPSCQPPGWAAKPTQYRNLFSPAVCPSGWTAYSLRKLEPTTYAYCCSSDYTLDNQAYFFPISLPACFKSLDLASSTFSTSETTTTPAGADTTITQTRSSTLSEAVAKHLVTALAQYTPQYTDGVQVHRAWLIEWESGDISTLSPRPPETFSCDSIASWDPAGPTPTQTGSCPEYPPHDPTWDHYDLILGLPVAFGGFLFISFIGLWIYMAPKRQERRKRTAEEIARVRAQREIERQQRDGLQLQTLENATSTS